MIRDTRWQYPRPRPTAATLRALAEVQAALDAPPIGMDAADYLAEQERLRCEAEARHTRQGCLPLGPA